MNVLEDQVLNKFINQDDIEEFGHTNISTFIKDKDAFNQWYNTVGFLSLDPNELKGMIEEVNFQENKLNIISKAMDLTTVEKISLYDMVDDD